MPVCSMTGFARADGLVHEIAWLWELKSVNGKGLDVRLRLPPGFDAIEQNLRRACAKALTRGNLQISLTTKEQSQSTELVVNQAALDSVLKIADELNQSGKFTSASVDGLLGIRGVLEECRIEPDEQTQNEILSTVEDGFSKALSALVDARKSEGASMAAILGGQIDQISELVEKVASDTSRSPQAIREKLKTQVDALLEASPKLDEERLHAEAAILATKADLQEEIDRLRSHIQASKTLLKEGGAIGRRLDFMAQEFNRECNTICSKSNAPSVTAIGLDLKVLVDQFREQIQNIE